MKKILAIMLIAVIAVAGVFAYTAPSNTTVKLNYVVKGIFQPAYKLLYNGSDATSSITVYTNEAKDIGIEEGTSGTFTLKDATKFSSDLASALKLAVSVDQKWAVANDPVATASANVSTLSIEYFNVVTVSGDDVTHTQVADVQGEKAVKMEYLQTLDRSNAPADVATFKVKWTAAPGAAAATYTANLTVTFTTM